MSDEEISRFEEAKKDLEGVNYVVKEKKNTSNRQYSPIICSCIETTRHEGGHH